jgi:hypothetical protein
MLGDVSNAQFMPYISNFRYASLLPHRLRTHSTPIHPPIPDSPIHEVPPIHPPINRRFHTLPRSNIIIFRWRICRQCGIRCGTLYLCHSVGIQALPPRFPPHVLGLQSVKVFAEVFFALFFGLSAFGHAGGAESGAAEEEGGHGEVSWVGA